jgi:predicted alpha/beta superfamily hydrolase
VWLDVGERETDTEKGSEETLRRARRLAEVLTDNGMREGEQFRYLEVPGGTHHESAWGARFDQVLRFLFGPASGRV